MCRISLWIVLAVAAAFPAAAAQPAAGAASPWMDVKLTADQRAGLLVKQMTLDEQVSLLHGQFPAIMKALPPGVQKSAGYVPGIARLGIPALYESDASLGVANAGRENDDAAPLPSGLAIASTFSPELAFAGGAVVGKEARQKGFNVMLNGGVNLARDPRNGRNFEYFGEDPLLAGTLSGQAIRGIQSVHVVSTAKHFALNDQETGRGVLDARIDEAALRESELLAFEIAVKTGEPGSVMCAYNKVNGVYACENAHLLTEVLKRDWGWRGWVMSDWGAVHSFDAVMAGLDQESAIETDPKRLFDAPLKAAVADGKVPAARVRDMARRVLRGMFAVGLFDHPMTPGGLDTAADGEVSGRIAEQGIVLLRNQGGLLPLAAGARRIAVIGGHADVGVLSGGGSAQVIPLGSIKFPAPKDAPSWVTGEIYHPSSPLEAIRARAGGAEVVYADGSDPAVAAAAVRDADVAVVFATQWTSEGRDTRLALDGDQDRLIEAVAASNPRTVVVLETGNPVLMPWLDKAGAVLEAWYPGARGGEAIARVLYGEVDASGRLPVTFPAGEDQLPRPQIPGAGGPPEGAGPPPKPFDVDYTEGSDVGYRWFARTGRKPLFPFGFGLSYTRFKYAGLTVQGGRTLTLSVSVTNTGDRPGTDTPQAYLQQGPRRTQQRLIGWSRVTLMPGETRRVTMTADRRLLADWDADVGRWRLDPGRYRVFVGPDAASPSLEGAATVQGTALAP